MVRSVVLLLLLVSFACGQQDVQKIKSGELVCVKIKDADSVLWFPRNPWDLKNQQFQLMDGEFALIFIAPTKTKTVVVTCAKMYDGKLSGQDFVFEVEGVGPQPDPDPEPDPDPDPKPNIPDGAFGLTKWAYETASKLDSSHLLKASEIANVYDRVANRATVNDPNLNPIKDVPTMLSETKSGNQSVIGQSGAEYEAWRDGFFVPKSKKLGELNTSGELKTVSQHVAAWEAIADGLRLAINTELGFRYNAEYGVFEGVSREPYIAPYDHNLPFSISQ